MHLSQAFIFAAGEGRRMLPLTKNTPKPLLKIDNKPIISYSIEKINKFSAITKIIINAFYLSDQIKEFINLQNDNKIIISQENAKLETGGGLLFAIEKIDLNNLLLIINGDILWQEKDNFSEINFLWQKWQEITSNDPKCRILLGLKEKENLIGYDTNITNSGDFNLDGYNLYYDKNIATKFVYTGLAIIDPKILNTTRFSGCFSFLKFITQDIKENGFLPYTRGVKLNSKFFHIGDYKIFNKISQN